MAEKKTKKSEVVAEVETPAEIEVTKQEAPGEESEVVTKTKKATKKPKAESASETPKEVGAKEKRKAAKRAAPKSEKQDSEAEANQAIAAVKRRHGKVYADLVSAIDRSEPFELEAVVPLLKETAKAKFDAATELHIRLGVDTRHADQQVRATVALPHGLGKQVTVAVIAPADKQVEAKSAGADHVGEDDLIKKIEEGKVEFDVVVATPEVMGKVGRLGKTLGTKGLMPNPKSGTVTPDVGKAVKEIKAGRLEFRADKSGIIHAAFGKVSFTNEQLTENLKALLGAIMQAKPAGAKGTYVRSIYVTTTMGPSFRLDSKLLGHLND